MATPRLVANHVGAVLASPRRPKAGPSASGRAASLTRAFDDPIPDSWVRQDLADAITVYLKQRYGMRRTPVAASRTLALICELYHRHMPYPPRQIVRDAVGCSIFAVDAAVNVYLLRGELTEEVGIAPGGVSAHENVVRRKFYIPSQALIDLSRMQHGAGKRRA